ncbi:hypothetical protein N657DRAFT_367817 [Parathielavia appendiculata]|uniref:Uncharacterized protein n=1 Tax=Parathielavia appendiculata TaxID=2587402 RepID=A0AAN6YZS1_9PEZI|nr:hypothetical protein N657DRAFT_367817 [Parathielavia appendiculata]
MVNGELWDFDRPLSAAPRWNCLTSATPKQKVCTGTQARISLERPLRSSSAVISAMVVLQVTTGLRLRHGQYGSGKSRRGEVCPREARQSIIKQRQPFQRHVMFKADLVNPFFGLGPPIGLVIVKTRPYSVLPASFSRTRSNLMTITTSCPRLPRATTGKPEQIRSFSFLTLSPGSCFFLSHGARI